MLPRRMAVHSFSVKALPLLFPTRLRLQFDTNRRFVVPILIIATKSFARPNVSSFFPSEANILSISTKKLSFPRGKKRGGELNETFPVQRKGSITRFDKSGQGDSLYLVIKISETTRCKRKGEPSPPGTTDSTSNTSKPGRINDPGSRFRENLARKSGGSGVQHPFGEVSPYFVANTQVYEERWENAKEQQIRTSVYPVGDGLLPVRGGRIPVRDARYHNGVFQPRGHINHLLVYHRRHGAAYLCNQKKNG